MTELINETDIKAGQAVYTPWLLKLYDIYVLNISNRWIWRCPKEIQLAQFNKYVSNNHLDIGVGTGYYLKKCTWPQQTKLALMDLNPNCLARAKLSVPQLKTKIYQADIYKAQLELTNKFDSISMNYLLHCLPGDMSTKTVAIANAVAMLKPGGILFGATILADSNFHTKISARLADFYCRKRIFSNQKDNLQALKNMLTQHLEKVDIEVHGAVALFKGYKN